MGQNQSGHPRIRTHGGDKAVLWCPPVPPNCARRGHHSWNGPGLEWPPQCWDVICFYPGLDQSIFWLWLAVPSGLDRNGPGLEWLPQDSNSWWQQGSYPLLLLSWYFWLNGVYVLPNRGCSQQSLPFPFGAVLVIQGSSVYVVDYCPNRSRWGAWASTMGRSFTFRHCSDVLLQVSRL